MNSVKSEAKLNYPMRIDLNYRYTITYFDPPASQGPFYCNKFLFDVRITPKWTDLEVTAEIGNTQWPGLLFVISIYNSSLDIANMLVALDMIDTWLISINNIKTIEPTSAHK